MKRKASIVSQNWKKSLHSLNNRDIIYNPEMSQPIKKESLWKQFGKRLSKMFDLDLFKDPIYVNIMIGLSLAVFAEINFSLLTAFILNEFGLSTDQIATFMSILGIADIIFRFLAPYIGQFLKLTARPMYVITLFMLMLSRFCKFYSRYRIYKLISLISALLISNNYFILLGVALGLGIAKGVRTVYMSLVIPNYVPIEKYASASGIQMMVNGFCILIGGPIIGKVRDITGSYTLCIVILNSITFSTIALWTVEALVRKIKRLKNNKTEKTEIAEQDTLL